MKRWSLVLFISLSLIWVAHVRTDGFSPDLIAGPLGARPADPATEEIETILSQPFHYLAKGRQSFVFASADGNYVLKFFNQKYLRDPWYAFLVQGEKAKRALRRSYYENSYAIAQREFGEEILYLHLGPSDRALPPVSITDKAACEHTLDLNLLPFVLQKRGISFYAGLDAAYERGGMEGLCRELDAFVEAISLRIAKNIADGDRDVENNWGYVDGHIFHLDPGRLYFDPKLADPARQKSEWDESTRAFRRWLQRHYPAAAAYFDQKVFKSSTTSASLV